MVTKSFTIAKGVIVYWANWILNKAGLGIGKLTVPGLYGEDVGMWSIGGVAPAVGVSALLWTRGTALIVIAPTLPHLLLLTKGVRSSNASIPRTVSHTILVPSHPLDSVCSRSRGFWWDFSKQDSLFPSVFYLFSRRWWNKCKLREAMKTEGLTSEGRGGRARQ